MSQPELLKLVVESLEKAGIEYMVTGSIVSSLQGEPRSTHDIDLVVTIKKSEVHQLMTAFSPPRFYLDQDSILEAIDRRSMFNLIDVFEGDKVDFWILSGETFDQTRFSRKHQEEFAGTKMMVTSPEDTILAKLRWAKLSGGSEKQYIDALRVYEVQYKKLDQTYLNFWVRTLKLEDLWERLTAEAEVL